MAGHWSGDEAPIVIHYVNDWNFGDDDSDDYQEDEYQNEDQQNIIVEYGGDPIEIVLDSDDDIPEHEHDQEDEGIEGDRVNIEDEAQTEENLLLPLPEPEFVDPSKNCTLFSFNTYFYDSLISFTYINYRS